MNPKNRVRKQGYSDFEIIEQHIDKNTAANREVELQKQYGYKVDKTKYNQVDYVEMGKIAGEYAKKTGHIQKIQKEGCKISASLPRSKKQLEQAKKVQKIGGPIAWGLSRSEKQMQHAYRMQKIGCVMGGKVQGAIMKEKLRVPIAAYLKSNGSYIGEWPSVMDCARELELKAPDIFHCLNPNKKQYSTKGYTFIKLKNKNKTNANS
jgi:hypothetical protein